MVRIGRDELGLGVCLDCRRPQEVETRDWPEAVMCDNCAFRRGSPERADPYRWAEIMETFDRHQPFHCHKGLHCDIQSGAFAAPDPATGRVTMCAGWAASYLARHRPDRADVDPERTAS